MRKRKRNSLLTLLAVIGVLLLQHYYPADTEVAPDPIGHDAGNDVVDAWNNKRSRVWMEVGGRIVRDLPDDNEGSRHQRFILDVGDGHTVMVAHNIDLAERVPASRGDRIELRGRYEWNEKGGVLHWTHHDPNGRIEGGWIRSDGDLYR